MQFFLSIARLIDKINDKIAAAVSYALLAAVLICSGNAAIRYTFNASSNAWLEIQWVLFAAVFLLASAATLKDDGHVRIDVIAGRLSARAQVYIDLFGLIFFLLPVTLLIVYYSVPYALIALQSKEYSSNAGGLILWPAKVLIPLGFIQLSLQGVAEIIKRIAYLGGHLELSDIKKHQPTPQEEIDAIKAANNL